MKNVLKRAAACAIIFAALLISLVTFPFTAVYYIATGVDLSDAFTKPFTK